MVADKLFEPQMPQNISGQILIFSIAMGADYSFELNSIETYAPQFLDIIIYS